ncbi:MAG: hypothetical protein QW212_05725 [Nitrososphaerales archaeon]
MKEKAFVSVEGESSYLCIPSKKRVEKVDTSQISDVLSTLKVKRAIFSIFLDGLQTLRIPLQVSLASVRKNRGFIKGVIRSELQKRGLNFNEVVYSYTLREQQAIALITVYYTQIESFAFLEEILRAGIEVGGCYPSFAPIIHHVTVSDPQHKSRAILVVSDRLRILFVTDGKDLLLQRSFFGADEALSADDAANIDATIGYAIRNFRTRIQELLVFSKAEHPLEGIGIETKFVILPEFRDYPIIPFLTEKYEKSLKGMELVPDYFKTYVKIDGFLKYAKVGLSLVILALIPFLVYNFSQYQMLRKAYLEKKKALIAIQNEVSPLLNRAKELESTLRPLINITNRKNSNPDSRELLHKLSDLSKIESVSIDSIQLSIEKISTISISGKVLGTSFERKEGSFQEVKNTLIQKGFRVSEEKWDIMKGEFAIKVNYGT